MIVVKARYESTWSEKLHGVYAYEITRVNKASHYRYLGKAELWSKEQGIALWNDHLYKIQGYRFSNGNAAMKRAKRREEIRKMLGKSISDRRKHYA